MKIEEVMENFRNFIKYDDDRKMQEEKNMTILNHDYRLLSDRSI